MLDKIYTILCGIESKHIQKEDIQTIQKVYGSLQEPKLRIVNFHKDIENSTKSRFFGLFPNP